ncbi:hypothetical protein LVY72_21870 [Arthrobacter sp. I2-34]|uniref:Antitoxin Xre/MbcA/ParS-like toxin-binding domain-containing protein n=1 Tax=Arthrobacter hankyongi TaxID=2904801 RepID=A0ABS9LCX8_9MICC|nr:hypothetical protein [Arthrobacter hankyongi]MCG2624541.1 hypothetical protein [Arthrobacter hankyongi]
MKDTRYDTGEAAGTALEEMPVLVKWLCQVLTPELVVHLAGAREPGVVRGWASGRLVPSAPEEHRLWFAYDLLRRIEDLQGREATQAWFMAVNSRLGQRSPLRAIREGRFHETAAAAGTLLEGARER